MQENAQLLATEDLPKILLRGILNKANIPKNSDTAVLVNLTPYDGLIERVARKWRDREQQNFGFKTLSMTKSAMVADFVEKAASLELMQDLKFLKPTKT